MLTDLLCWFKYGRTRFGLMEHYGISLMRLDPEFTGDKKGDVWNACSSIMEFDYGYNTGVWVRAATPYGALITCVELIEQGKL